MPDGTIYISLRPDAKWLDSAIYPVVLDPTVEVTIGPTSGVSDKYFSHPVTQPCVSATGSWFDGYTFLSFGKPQYSSQCHHACIRFDTSGIPGTAGVVSAGIELYSPSSTTGHHAQMREITEQA